MRVWASPPAAILWGGGVLCSAAVLTTTSQPGAAQPSRPRFCAPITPGPRVGVGLTAGWWVAVLFPWVPPSASLPCFATPSSFFIFYLFF